MAAGSCCSTSSRQRRSLRCKHVAHPVQRDRQIALPFSVAAIGVGDALADGEAVTVGVSSVAQNNFAMVGQWGNAARVQRLPGLPRLETDRPWAHPFVAQRESGTRTGFESPRDGRSSNANGHAGVTKQLTVGVGGRYWAKWPPWPGLSWHRGAVHRPAAR
jgi:hypothetical protein